MEEGMEEEGGFEEGEEEEGMAEGGRKGDMLVQGPAIWHLCIWRTEAWCLRLS